jgi:hypothetical protein
MRVESPLKSSPPSSGACPDRAPPRAAGLQAAPAGGGGARGGPPAPGGRRAFCSRFFESDHYARILTLMPVLVAPAA